MLGLSALGDRLFSFRRGEVKRKGHDSRAIANYLVGRLIMDRRQFDVLRLNKLVYLAHGWHLAHHGEPLICHQVLSWENGPMIREVYGAFRLQNQHIRQLAYSPESGYAYPCKLTDDEVETLNTVYDAYTHLSYPELSALVKQPGTPWALSRDIYPGGCIPNPVIQAYYEGLIEQSEEKRA